MFVMRSPQSTSASPPPHGVLARLISPAAGVFHDSPRLDDAEFQKDVRVEAVDGLRNLRNLHLQM